ncbi:MAG: hypothetical protein RMK65_02180 [Anaerolineae bacterium]|nr:hypothetical protein [Anaerolineae bacterium]MDW7990951.1 hypothetical protein [Anaerolineae bacterium]
MPGATMADLFDLLIQSERATERFYMGLVELFLHEPTAAEVWWEMAAEEAMHVWLLEKAREAVAAAGRLEDPVEPAVLEESRRLSSFNPERLWARIRNLEDAYEAAHEVEGLEFDALLEPLLLDMFPGDIRNRIARSQFDRHQTPLKRLRTREWRLSVEARRPKEVTIALK